MFAPLVSKSFADARWLLPGCAALMLFVQWLRVWITSQIPLAQLKGLLELLPQFVKNLFPVPLDQVATPHGRIALSYDDPLVLFLLAVWAIARGSDAVSGEIGRGTMEMLLAQPVSRLRVIAAQATATLTGAAVIAAAAWLGTALGIATIPLEEPVDASRFVPAAMSHFSLCAFLAGLTTLFSSADHSRWRTISLAGAVYVIGTIIRIVGLTVRDWRFILNFTFFTPFDPEGCVARPDRAWQFATISNGAIELGGLGCHALLVGMGLVGYALAALIFCRRDLPAPLWISTTAAS